MNNKKLVFAAATFLLLFCTALQTLSWAQSPPFIQLSEDEDLPSNTIYDIFQDSKGYIWLGTDGGLYRYDGVKFVRFLIKTTLGRSVTNIQEDRTGRIWMRNFSNEVFYIDHDSVKKLNLLEKYVGGAGNNLQMTDDKASLFLNLTHYSLLIDIESLQDKASVKEINTYGQIQLLGSSTNYLSMNYQTLYLNQGSQKRKLLSLEGTGGLFYANAQRGSVVFFANQKYVYRYDIKTQTLVQIADLATALLGATVLNLRTDNDNNLWLCTSQGAWVLTEQGFFLLDGKPLLKGMAVSDLLDDAEGNIWLSTTKNGLFFFPDLRIKSFTEQNSSIPNNFISRLVSTPNDKLFIGIGNGQVLTLEHNEFKQIHQFDHYDIGLLKYSTEAKCVFAAAEKLIALDQQTAEQLPEYSIAGHCKDLVSLNNMHLLIGFSYMSAILPKDLNQQEALETQNNWYHKVKGVETLPKRDFANPNAGADEKIFVFRQKRTRALWVEHKEKAIWIAYADGLYFYTDKEPRAVTYNGQTISGTSFAQTNNDRLWVSSVEQGLFELKNGEIIRRITTENGLVDNYGTYITARGHELYICTNKGLQIFDTEKNKFTLFDKTKGLPTRAVNHVAPVRDGVWIATSKGLVFVPNESLFRKDQLPPVQITGLEVKGNNYSTLIKDLKLEYDSASLNISFWSAIYRTQGKHQFKYRLLGLDSTWVHVDCIDAIARIPSIPEGNYVFEVCAVIDDGLTSDTTRINISVSPPYWKTWWFMLLMALALVSVTTLVFLKILMAVRRRNDIEQELRKSQLASLQTQMNPHFIFNALNSIQEFILQNEKRLANTYLSKFANLMRLILNMSTQEYALLDEELKVLRLYLELEAIRFEDFDYELHVSDNVATDYVKIPSMLIQPYIENAMKHGLLHLTTRSKKLQVLFDVNPSQTILQVEIIDNGVGRQQSAFYKQQQPHAYKSFATSATQRRLELLNIGREQSIGVQILDLLDAENKACGTHVKLQIPI
ncbi:MAG: hypothetical protein EAZ57_09315 [Cytophagales bacterium]|nr:MAG: hypothetical protein EAZ67_10120 [Cytophagales bacterium]TAF59965.1 MAG: hypothetical protein EAZ57_09315 [Cytophagales bacterium]